MFERLIHAAGDAIGADQTRARWRNQDGVIPLPRSSQPPAPAAGPSALLAWQRQFLEAARPQAGRYVRRLLRHPGALAPALRGLLGAGPAPAATAWPAALAAALAALLAAPPERKPLAFRLLVEALVLLGMHDLLEAASRDPRRGPALLLRLQRLAPRLGSQLRALLAHQVSQALPARRDALPETLPGLPASALGLQPEAAPGAAGTSVIVALHGRAFQAWRLLASIGLLGADGPLEVLLHADAATTVDEAAIAALLRGRARFRLLRSPGRVAVGEARNRLVAAASHARIVSLDADMVLLRPADALCPPPAALPLAPGQVWNLGYLGVRDLASVKLGKQVAVLPAAGAGPRTLRNLTALRLSGPTLQAAAAAAHLLPGNRMSGGASCFPQALFLALGGFSAAFDIGWEDLEFSLRLAASGRWVLNPLAAPLFHGHLMPFTAADLAVEQARFDPARFAPGLRVLARQGLRPEGAGRPAPADPAGDGAMRTCPFKLALLPSLAPTMLDTLTPGPVVAWVMGSEELASAAVRQAMAAAPLWRNAVLLATEVASLDRLAASCAGADAVVLGAAAARFLAARSEAFAPSFAALNQVFDAPCLVLGPEAMAVERLRALLPRAQLRLHPETEPTTLALALARATAPRRRATGRVEG